jgi:hypothetical protein
VHGSFDFSKNRWFPVFHPPKNSIKEPPVLGILKNPESKNQPVWVY